MVDVVPVTPDMFEQVYPILEGFRHPYYTKQDWERLFTYNWPKAEEHVGYALIDEGKVVGFLGLIFSERLVGNKTVKFCSTSSWIVDKNYRNESMSLVFPLLNLKEYTITNLSPSKTAFKIFQTLKFQILDERVVFLFPVPNIFALVMKKPECLTINPEEIKSRLTGELLRIFNDHLPYRCHHLYVKDGQEECYIQFNIIRKKKHFRFNTIHYISNPKLFRKYYDLILWKIIVRTRVAMTMVDERLLQSQSLPWSYKYMLPNSTLYKSSELQREQIDSLYSERVLLN